MAYKRKTATATGFLVLLCSSVWLDLAEATNNKNRADALTAGQPTKPRRGAAGKQDGSEKTKAERYGECVNKLNDKIGESMSCSATFLRKHWCILATRAPGISSLIMTEAGITLKTAFRYKRVVRKYFMDFLQSSSICRSRHNDVTSGLFNGAFTHERALI
jgi:hypothetical protein